MFFKSMKWAMLWAMLIFILCAIPGSDLPHISLLELISFDKFVHTGMFFVLVFLLIRGFKQQTSYQLLSKRSKLIALLLAVSYGALLEVMQGTLFIERTADIYDIIANSAGCLLALLLYNKVNNIKFVNQLLS